MTANWRIYSAHKSLFLNEKIHLPNENQTSTVAVKMVHLQWKQHCDVKVKGFHLGEPYGRLFSCLACAIDASYEAAAQCQASESWLPSNCSNRSPYGQQGFQHPSWKGNTTIGDIDLLSICPIPRLGDILFNCMAKTEMEQEIMEDITPWSCAKSAPSPSFPRMECWRIEGL